MGVLNLIASNNFIVVNKEFIAQLGLEEAILIGELASEYDYWKNKGELEDGYFFSTIENVEANTGLSEFKQRKTLKSMQEKGIIDLKIKGIPAKRYIKINENQVIKLVDSKFLNNSRTSSLKIKELDAEKLKGNNNIYNNNNNNNKKKLHKESLNVCKKAITRLNELTNSKFGLTAQTSVNSISSLLNAGYTEDDILEVIDKMCYKWGNPKKGTKDMSEFLRPSTLFRKSNFENYLGMNVKKKQWTTNDISFEDIKNMEDF